jgi:hypothetical protein
MPLIAELLRELDEARALMQATRARASAHHRFYPPWTLHQILAHITGWDDATLAALRAHAGGHESGTPASEGIDAYNAQTVAEREDLAFEQVVAEWGVAREQLKAALEAMPPERLAAPLVLPWGGYGTVESLVRVMIHHEREHAEEIQRLLAAPQ